MGIENARYQMRWNLYKPPSTHLFLHFLPPATSLITPPPVSTQLQVSTHLSYIRHKFSNRPHLSGSISKAIKVEFEISFIVKLHSHLFKVDLPFGGAVEYRQRFDG